MTYRDRILPISESGVTGLTNKLEEIAISPASYIIYIDGSTIKAVNGTTGVVDYYGSDASTVIQSALNGLIPGRTWQERVVVKGNYIITATISIPSYTKLDINGQLYLTNGTNNHIISNADTINGNQNISIVGGYLHGNKTGQSSTSIGIFFKKVNSFSIQDVYLYRTRDESILLNQCYNGNIAFNETAEASISGITTEQNTRNVNIISNICRDNALYGINIEPVGSEYCHHMNVIGNNIRGNTTNGIYIESGRQLNIINNQSTDNGESGIALNGTIECTISDNIIQTNHFDGIIAYLDGTSSGYNNNFNHNICIGNYQHGIYINGITRNIINNNICKNNSQQTINIWSGITLDTGSDRQLITENFCYDDQSTKTQSNGIYTVGNNYISLINNWCEGNITTQINRNGVNDIVKNNLGYLTENSGSSTGTGAQQSIAHGLAITPTRQQIALTAGSATALPYHSAAPDATNIYVTAANNQPWYWGTVGT